MNWSVRLAEKAAKQLYKLTTERQKFIFRHLRVMEEDPFIGDVKPLKGKEWKGRFRKRAGRYRIIFVVFPAQHVVEISQILIRTEKTYR